MNPLLLIIAVSSLTTLAIKIDLVLACLAAKKREWGKSGDIYFPSMEILDRGMTRFRAIIRLTTRFEILGVAGGLAMLECGCDVFITGQRAVVRIQKCWHLHHFLQEPWKETKVIDGETMANSLFIRHRSGRAGVDVRCRW